MDAVPPEILTTFMRHALAESFHAGFAHLYDKDYETLAFVCKKWRGVALSNGPMASKIYIDGETTTLTKMETKIERARRTGADIHIHLRIGGPLRVTGDERTASRADSLAFLCCMQSLIQPLLHRCKAMYAGAYGKDNTRVLLGVLELWKVPQLETLHVRVAGGMPSSEPGEAEDGISTLFRIPLPVFKHIILDGAFALAFGGSYYGGLTSLELRFIDDREATPVHRMLDVLASASKLQHLFLRFVCFSTSDDYPLRSIILSELDSLHVATSGSCDTIGSLLRNVTTPGLRKVRLTTEDDYGLSEFMEQCGEMLRLATELEADIVIADHKALHLILDRLPNLKRLDTRGLILGCSFDELLVRREPFDPGEGLSAIVAIARDHAEGDVLCPQLERLEFRDLDFDGRIERVAEIRAGITKGCFNESLEMCFI